MNRLLARMIIIAIVFTASVGSGPPRVLAGGAYTITDLGTLGGAHSGAYAINNAGQVVGWARTAGGGQRAFLWQDGSMTDLLGMLGGSTSSAWDISDAGQVTGVATNTSGRAFPFLWENGVMTNLGTLGGLEGWAYGINQVGQVVGAAKTGAGATHAFLYSSGTMQDLGTLPGGSNSVAQAINYIGQVVGGDAYTSSGYAHAFLWEDGSGMTDLGTHPNGLISRAFDINDTGRIVGSATTSGTSSNRPVMWINGVLTVLDNRIGHAFAINNNGEVVGRANFGTDRAFLWRNGTMIDLTSLLPADSGWTLLEARDINDSGQIVGTGSINGQNRAYLLTPATTAAAPAVASVTPESGPAGGGTNVTITGTNFAGGAGVTFGATAATNVVVVDATTITADTPAHTAGSVDVVVTNPDGQSGALAGGFTYVAAPTVTDVAPASGTTAGGTAVTIAGAAFQPGAAVWFGGAPATDVTVDGSSTITAVTPPNSAGTVDVVVTNPDGQSGTLAGGFTYVVPPTVNRVRPPSGPTTGGKKVTITGADFAPGATVSFGSVAATDVVVVSDSKITAVAPPHAAGAVDVTVTNPDGGSGTLVNGFTYRPRGKTD